VYDFNIVPIGAISSAANGLDTTVLWVTCDIMSLGVLAFGYLRLRKAIATSRGFSRWGVRAPAPRHRAMR